MAMLDFPLELYQHQFFRHFSLETFPTFCRISKKANEIVKAIANVAQDDYVPDGPPMSIKLDGSTRSLALHLFKMQIVTDFPHLLLPVETTKVMIKDVIFDYQTKKIRAKGKFGLGGALEAAILEKSPTLVFAIFAHPNAEDIPADGPWSLGDALGLAARVNSFKLVRIIFSHRNGHKIPGDGFWGLGPSLIYAVRNKNFKIVQMILSQQNANKIPASGGISLKLALKETEKIDNPEIVEALNDARNKKRLLYRIFMKKN